MSPARDELFNTWFPAIVGGLVIGLLATALWDLLRRKTWLFASRFWPGILKEVGLDHPSLSRTEVEERQREVTEMLSALSSQISRTLVPGKSSMAETTEAESSNSNSSVFSNSGFTNDFDIEAQTGINPLYTPTPKPITFTATAYFPDDTPIVVVRRTKVLFQRYARGTVKRWKSSIILQASLPIDPWVLAEIGKLAKDCIHVENRCTFQLGNWAILYYNAGTVQLRVLTEGDVPVNVEARWQEERTGIAMCGLYLNGSQIKVATERTSTTLRSAGPAAQGPGDLDELHFPTEGLDGPGEDSIIYAAKVVEADGISLIGRSEASFILPPRENISLIEAIWVRMQRISLSAKKMIKSLLKVEYRQPDITFSGPDVEFDFAHFELLAEHWKGVSEIELVDTRKEVLYYLRELPTSGLVEHACPQPSHFFSSSFIRDQSYLEYWQRGLQDLNEVIMFSNNPENMNGSQSGTHISIRGGIKFLLGDFEGALQDFDLADNLNTGGHRSTVLLERALVKCILARYSDAMQDISAVIAINPNLNDIQELHTCLQQILYQLPLPTSQNGPLSQRPQPSDQHNSVLIIPDLLTGDEWCSGESVQICSISDDITAGDSTADLSSINSSVTDFKARFSAPPEHHRTADELGATRCDMEIFVEEYHVRTCKHAETIMSDSSYAPDASSFHTALKELLSSTDEAVVKDPSGEDRASTSGRSEYFSARIERMMQSSCRFSDQGPHLLSPTGVPAIGNLEDVWGPNALLFDSRSLSGCKKFMMNMVKGDLTLLNSIPLSGPLSLDQSLITMLGIAEEMRYIHSMSGVAHRDLKAPNVLLSYPQKVGQLNGLSNQVVAHMNCRTPIYVNCGKADSNHLKARKGQADVQPFPASDGNGSSTKHRGRRARTNPKESITANDEPSAQPPSPKPSSSVYYGVRFRPDLHKWVAEIRVAEWKAIDKKVWLGTFDSEQGAARGVDLARKLLKCTKKHPYNLPCNKLDAYLDQIPSHLVLTDVTTTSMFKAATLFIKRECREYAASFDSPTVTPTSDHHDSQFSLSVNHILGETNSIDSGVLLDVVNEYSDSSSCIEGAT